MIKGVTKQGFRFTLTEDRLDNYELFELFAEIDTNPLVLPKVAQLLLGDKQYGILKNRCKNESGYISNKKMFAEIEQILLASQKVKN